MLRYYHINKDTNQVVTLSSLFPQGSDYVTVLSQQVKRLAWRAGGCVLLTRNLPPFDPEQSFYWGEDGSLVLVFDEGSVLPASSGNPEVTIPAQVVQQLMDGA